MHFDCIGLTPHNQFANGVLDMTGVESGYLRVDGYFRTFFDNKPNDHIFAFGDCCQTPNNMMKFASVTLEQSEYVCKV